MSRHEPDGLDPRLAEAFEALRAASAEPARPEAVSAARRAMHLAAAERDQRGRLALVAERLGRVLTVHRLSAAVAGAAVALTAVTALGWNAPVGAPLHVVQVAHERITLDLPGIDRASLDLSYAEARLEEVAGGHGDGAALGEAQRLLDDARDHLPADHSSAAWQRWADDSRRLESLRDKEQGDLHGVPAAGTEASPTPRSGDDRGESSTSTTSSASRSGEGGGGSSSTQTEGGFSTSSGGDGEHGGSSSSTSTSASTSESSGGDH